jgi:hypothetical protein
MRKETDMTIVDCYDATHDNISHLPRGQAAGYSTGTGGVPWTAHDWAAHPGAVRIDQDPAASDPTADILDVENGAATLADCAPWAQRALADFRSAARRGQRSPAIYMSQSNVTPVVNSLIAGGVMSGIGLWIANWDLTRAGAAAEVNAASGPFPIVGIQYNNAGLYDESVFSSAWLQNVSRQPAQTQFKVPPPGRWKGLVTLTGKGLDGNEWKTTGDPSKDTWSTPVRA